MNARSTSTWIAAAVGGVFLAIIGFQYFGSNQADPYVEKIEQSRRDKDRTLRHNPDLLPDSTRGRFQSLDYFAPDPAYKVAAQLVQDQRPDTLVLLTTTNERQRMVRMGQFVFTLQGRPCKLAAYRYLDTRISDFFVPFRDLTNGASTYEGGRYLDIPNKTPLFLDFNLAYSPYCAYNLSYSCPIPPKENNLPLEIAAGEKAFVLPQ